jgi:signal transduction histidine kinase/CheY-like chemotaxis protein
MTQTPDPEARRLATLARYHTLFNAIDDGFCIIEFIDGPHGPLSDYLHVEANPGYERHSGIRDIVGKTLREIDPTDADGWVEIYGDVLRTGATARFERYFLSAGRHIEVSASRVEPPSLRQVSILFRDISARKKAEEERDRAIASLRAFNETLEQRVAERTAELMRAEEQLRQAQKMEAVGQLTGGLAHDFNNLLAGVSGSLQLLGIRLSQGRIAEVDKYVVAAQGAVRRAAALTHRLLAFSRRQTLDPRPTDVNALVNGMTELIQRTVGPGIKVESVGATGLWPALVDSGQLENALLNLCINARDAMPDGGRITIETANKWIDHRAAQSHDMPEGQFLSLCVTDTGTGMTPDVIANAFDPFFTTKPIGMGTGLGLSMIYGFAKQSGGQVRIYSEVGQGTTVCIYLPRFYGGVDDDAADQSASPISGAESGETVLVVDDEPSVRMLIVDVLEEAGYAVIEAADSIAGLKLLQSNVRIDLLISDVGLPGGMNGRQMADAARETRPDLKVLFITGYAENSVIGNGRLKPGMQVLTKPFAIETLAARVRQLVDE